MKASSTNILCGGKAGWTFIGVSIYGGYKPGQYCMAQNLGGREIPRLVQIDHSGLQFMAYILAVRGSVKLDYGRILKFQFSTVI